MLNLALRPGGKVDPKEKITMNRTSLEQALEAALTNLSDEINMSVFVDKPGDKHTGLPGDVVITEMTIKCGQSVFSPMGHCPAKCPYFTQIAGGSDKGCFFKCVAAAKCGSEDAKETVPDIDLGVCRQCNNIGCAECSGKGDACAKCAKGYVLQDDGSCSSIYAYIWKYLFIFFGAVMTFLLIWVIQLGCAPITNKEGLEEGLQHRSSIKLHAPLTDEALVSGDPAEGREMFPISTNLHVTQVAGPGLTLHMNFQMASIMWCNTLIVVWLLFVYMTDARQLTIGLLPAETPPQLCAVTMQGRSLQETQMPFKAAFIVTVYFITFIGSIAYAVVNKRVFENIEDESSMEDFAAIVHGLPPIRGTDKDVEKDLKECIYKTTGEKVVGVSIAWDYSGKAEAVEDILDKDLISRQEFEQPTPDPNVYDRRPEIQKKIFGPVDVMVGGVLGLTIPDDDESQEVDDNEVISMLENMTTTTSAFVVFETEASRDKAVEMFKTKDVVAFKGGALKMKAEVFDPKVVLWENFHVQGGTLMIRILLGLVGILVALVVYSVCFYGPFAYYQSMFKFPNEPGAAEGLLFSMLVVAGNQIMYQICAAISDGAGFRFRDSAEALYVALYVLAVVLSVIFDMSVEFYLGYHSMADAGVKTADGRALSEMNHWQEIFESYPMQKVLGKRLFDYCFPATFTIPFLVEPIGTIVAPFTIQRWLLRTHPEVRGRNAEKSVEPFAPMDMGRYGDILLNLLLVCMIFFFPSGQILPILLTYVVSHAYIYCYDQYRILRCVPAFDYGSEEVDKYAQWMMILPCSTLAACAVFKLNCIEGNFCYEGWALAKLMSMAFFGHALLHFVLLKTIVPIVGALHKHVESEETYEQCAKKEPCGWFNANPIHCLRSKYVHKDEPSCCYYVQGKEHLIRKNAAIGVYFEDRRQSKKEIY